MSVAVVDLQSHTIAFGDEVIRLTRTQFGLFKALTRAKGRVLSAAYLNEVIEDITGHENELTSLNVHLCRLRAFLKPHGISIKNVFGVGYFITPWNFQVLPDVELEVTS